MNDTTADAPIRPVRRTLLRAMAASMLPFAVGCSGIAPARPDGFDLTSAAGRMRTLLRMRGSLDEQVVLGFATGRYYGVVDADPTPLFGVAAASITRYRRLPDGSVTVFNCGQAYYTDLDIREVLDEWINPYNGERGKVPVVRSEISRRTLTESLIFTGPAIPGVEFEQIVLPPERQAIDVVFVEQSRFSGAVPGVTGKFHYSEAVTLRSSATDLDRSETPRVPCSTAFTSISSWRPWMRMNDPRGGLVGHGSGRYGAALEDFPKAWLDATRKNRPELLDNPGRALEATWNS